MNGTDPGAPVAEGKRHDGGEIPRQPKLINRILDEVADELAELTERGFAFAETRDARGTVVALSGVRSHAGVVDIVQLFGEHDADAVRVPATETDIFFPRTVLWRVTGRPETVLAGIIALADPAPDTARTGGAPARRRAWMSQLSYRGA